MNEDRVFVVPVCVRSWDGQCFEGIGSCYEYLEAKSE